MSKDNLFDGKFTFLDAVKIALLIVTGFSTWNVVEIMTPDGSWAWVRQFAALIVVEGAFLGFEYATADAKSNRQVRWATIGFFCSLTVISLFAGLSGLLEFGGVTLMTQHAGDWLGLSWSVGDAVQASSLLTLVVWISVLASIYRIYTLNDPDKRAQLRQIKNDEFVSDEADNARKIVNSKVAHVVAGHRTLADIRSRYAGEMSAEQMKVLLEEAAGTLQQNYAVKPDTNFVPAFTPPQESLLHKLAQKVRDQAETWVAPSPVDKTVAVEADKGFVPRVPPMEKNVNLNDDTYHPVSYQPVREPFPEITRGEPIFFESAVASGDGGVKVAVGDELQAILCEDGKYNLSYPEEVYAFARVSPEELHYYQTGEEMPAADNFRQS